MNNLKQSKNTIINQYKPPSKTVLLNSFKEKETDRQFPPLIAKKSKKSKFLLLAVVFIFIFLVSFFSPAIVSTKNILMNFGSGSFLGIWRTVVKLISAQDKFLKGEKENRINILVLGVGGEGHEGPYLTDTIILLSLKPSTKEVSTISIPRDLYAPIPGYSWKKINTAYAFGEIKNQGGELITKVVENIFELPIHYYVVCDFSGFEEMIDIVDGIKVYVEKSFTDDQFPTFDFKTQIISFNQGWQKMSGIQALRFVRSRYGNNGEGSDFARSKRQQKIIMALKDKIFSFNTLLNPEKMSNFLDSLNEHIKTDLNLQEILRLADLAKEINPSKIITKVLDNGDKGPLYAEMTENGVYVLKPKAGSFKELSSIANNIFENNAAEEKTIAIKNRIIIQNGTTYYGLASNLAQKLESLNFEIAEISNAPEQNHKKTIIYDLTLGKKEEELKILKEKIGAGISYPMPKNEGLDVDFLIILGKDLISE